MADEVPVIKIDLDKPCAECGKGGATDNTLCMGCTAKAVAGEKMNTPAGKEVQKRFHNQIEKEKPKVAKSGFAKEALKSFVDRVERLSEERDALSADIREVFSEAKGVGFDTRILRRVIALRKMDKADYQEFEALLDLYLTNLDMR